MPAAFFVHRQRLVDLLARHPTDIERPASHTSSLRGWDPDSLDPRYNLGLFKDEWGSTWDNTSAGYQGRVVNYALDDWDALENFVPPPIPEGASNRRTSDQFRLAAGGNFFHRMCFLRSMEKVFMDLADGAPEIFKLREILLDFFRRQVERECAKDVDAIWFWDDFGTQRQLMMSLEMWRSFIRPVYEELFSICQAAQKHIFFHSCGFVTQVIDDLIEMGVDALNCQVWLMGLESLGDRFRGRITFWGDLSWQSTVPHGTPDDIRAEAARMKRYLAAPSGGIIGVAPMDGQTPFENIEAALTAWN
jgi:uroporphyrinogen decarboxylase